MALYHRQRGILHYVMRDADAAIPDLRRAVALNPRDDLAWRSLALAQAATNDADGARASLARAVDVQRSDPTNLLLVVRSALDEGETDEARELLSEVVQAWPAIIFSPAWDDLLANAPFDTAAVVQVAAQRWRDGLPMPEMVEDQGLWLTALAGDPDDSGRALRESGLSVDQARAMTLLLACEPATELLDDPNVADVQSAAYWRMRMRSAAITAASGAALEHIVELMAVRRPEINALNPLYGNSIRGTNADIWGYRRNSIGWPIASQLLPSPPGGQAAWLAATDCRP
jgi:tetratricopeptide (TPR) repeat protein